MLGTGATYALGLNGCQRPSDLQLLVAPRRILATPQFSTAHRYLRDRQAVPSPQRTETCDVIVVGGGFSGLSAMAQLEAQGKHAVLVESEARVGGAAVSEQLGGGMVPLGSVYFVERTDELDLLFRLSGIEPVECPPDGYDLGTGELVMELWADETLDLVLRNDLDRDGMKRFRDLILAMGDDVPPYPLPEFLTPELAALDVSAEEWVKEFRSQTLLTVLNSYSRSSMGALLSTTNVYCLQNFYSCEFGASFDLPRYTIAGGTGALTAGVLPALHDVRTGQIAVRVREREHGVEVDCVDADGQVVRYRAGHAVIAAPKFQVPNLVEGLPDAQVAACRQLAYAPYMTLHIVSDEPLIRPGVYDTWNLTSEFETDVVNPGSVPGTTFNRHVASLFIPMDQFARHQLLDSELFARKVADVATRFIDSRTPSEQASVREIYAWGWGHGLVVPTPGSHSGIAQTAARSMGRVHFANSDCDASPAIENAVYHGARAAGLCG